ncbi:MAG TPA: hypothetical protein VMF03_20710 [Steroidobacteraceae bacterium]|nr:hypothetical protein [Steroidobacteraceae bacterium]
MRRFTILIADDLADAFDLYASEHGYNSRYEAFRDLIRGALYQQRIQKAAWFAASGHTDSADPQSSPVQVLATENTGVGRL